MKNFSREKYYTINLPYSILLFFLTVDFPRNTLTLEIQSVSTGADITFGVKGTGDNLQFQWKKDGKEIDSNDHRFSFSQTDHSSALQIRCVEESDKGHYTCLVKSPVEKNKSRSLHAAERRVCIHFLLNLTYS